MKGKSILLTVDPRGNFLEGIISGTPKPGSQMEMMTTAPVNGRFTYRFLQPAADTDPRLCIVLLEDSLQGKTATDAYVTGTYGRLYCPLPGDELNMLVKDVSGTGDIHTVGDRFVNDHTTGKLIAQATSANRADFNCCETVAAGTADVLLHCQRV